jgi:L-lactate dehydrogenase
MTKNEAQRPSRVVIIGTGAVGATTAYTLFLRERVSELVLIDANHDKALGEALDMNHGLPFAGGVKLWAGDYSDCKDADIIVIAAGSNQRPGETRIHSVLRHVEEERLPGQSRNRFRYLAG